MTPDFFQVVAENSLTKNTLEEKKSLIVDNDFFWKVVLYWVHFGNGEDFKLTKELSKNVHYSYLLYG